MASEREKLIKGILRKYPDVGSRTIARLLHEQYPHEFASVDNARSAVRYLRGRRGDELRDADREFYEKHDPPREPRIPKGVRRKIEAATFRSTGVWLVLGDIHCPYHDEQAIEAAVRFAVDNGAEHLAINGDGVDFYKLSTWAKSPLHRDPDEELETFSDMLQYFAKTFPGTRVLKAGNHEARYQQYVATKASAIMGLEASDLRDVLRADAHGFAYVAPKQLYHIGPCVLAHGDEVINTQSPSSPAASLFRRIRKTAVASHFHRTSTHTDNGGIDGRVTRCYTIGCMCDMSPPEAVANDWNQGFALLYVGKDGSLRVDNKIVDRGEVV